MTRSTFVALAAGLVLAGSSGCGVGVVCGGPDALECPGDTFCRYILGACGEGDFIGFCTSPPDLCPQVFAPVCGCDGQTYDNACEAAAASVSIRHEGSCDGDQRICGGIAGLPCGANEFCKLPDGSCCCDFQGLCTPIPEACTQEFAPVCGCDDKTYSNACMAAAASVSIDHQGQCFRQGPG